MKIGLKTYDDIEFISHFKDKINHIEIMAIEGRDYSFFKELKIPVIIHAQHKHFGVNLADKTKREKNLSSLKFAIEIADLCNSDKIIVHPGELENENCSVEESLSFISKIEDGRILIENMPSKDNERVCGNAEQTGEYLKKAKKRFCFDINHAISTALQKKEDYLGCIKKYIKLKPAYYHLGGQRIETGVDDHLSFKDSNINLREILKKLPKDAELTLEVTQDISKTEYDLDLIKKLTH